MRKALLALAFALLAAMPAAARERRVAGAGHGRVTSVAKEADGQRVTLDRVDFVFHVADSLIGQRQILVGMKLRLVGPLRDGEVQVEIIQWPDGLEFTKSDKELSGRVERINIFEPRLWLRDERGKLVEVDTRSVGDERYRRRDLSAVRAGDRVTLRGSWSRETFRAFSIESVAAH